MSYLFGDHSEANLEIDYLAFLRQAIDCLVVLAEAELALAVTAKRKKARERETEAVASSIAELGVRATELVTPVVNDSAGTPVGRCATAIVDAIRGAVERETAQVKRALATTCDEVDAEDTKVRARAKDALEVLVRAYELPDAKTRFELAWTATTATATLHAVTRFGVETSVALDVPAGSPLAADVRVDRLADGVEVHTHETSGWLKKSDKLVALRLGRHRVVAATIAAGDVRVELQAPDGDDRVVVTARNSGEITLTARGADLAVDERDRAGLRQLTSRLEAEVESLDRKRMLSLTVDGTPIADYPHPRTVAERLVAAIAPTVQTIAKHSPTHDELVLRRPIADGRREELFVSRAELVDKLAKLPADARAIFAPLGLDAAAPEPQRAPPPAITVSGPPEPAVVPESPPPLEPPPPDPMEDEPTRLEPRRRPDSEDVRVAPRRTAPPPPPQPERAAPRQTAPPTNSAPADPPPRPAPRRTAPPPEVASAPIASGDPRRTEPHPVQSLRPPARQTTPPAAGNLLPRRPSGETRQSTPPPVGEFNENLPTRRATPPPFDVALASRPEVFDEPTREASAFEMETLRAGERLKPEQAATLVDELAFKNEESPFLPPDSDPEDDHK